MLTEPVECKSCGAVSVNGGTIHCHGCLKSGIRLGFAYALDQYGIWKDGEQQIGCMGRNIKDVMKQFDEEDTVSYLLELLRKKIETCKSSDTAGG